MLTSGWIKARNKEDLSQVRVHDLKHTFGQRLRAAGVSFEDRRDLLEHRSGRTPRTTRPPGGRASSRRQTRCATGKAASPSWWS